MKVLIADDHEIVRRGLREILADEFTGLEVYEARDGHEALAAVREQDIDVVLLDINMPGRGGLGVLEELKEIRPKLPVVIVSAFPEEDYALRAFKLGALGYVSKGGAPEELLTAIRKALAGGRYLTTALAERLAGLLAGEPHSAPHELLSNRELQVLRMIALGKTVKEVAGELALSEKTIATYRARISEKMHLSTNVELARYAMQHKLVD
ncbi:MAG TPA: response regulator transcription factor [Thermoleophilia bacterium]|nr:response regulator transcription factor [Thermoleophilia bacterium]